MKSENLPLKNADKETTDKISERCPADWNMDKVFEASYKKYLESENTTNAEEYDIAEKYTVEVINPKRQTAFFLLRRSLAAVACFAFVFLTFKGLTSFHEDPSPPDDSDNPPVISTSEPTTSHTATAITTDTTTFNTNPTTTTSTHTTTTTTTSAEPPTTSTTNSTTTTTELTTTATTSTTTSKTTETTTRITTTTTTTTTKPTTTATTATTTSKTTETTTRITTTTTTTTTKPTITAEPTATTTTTTAITETTTTSFNTSPTTTTTRPATTTDSITTTENIMRPQMEDIENKLFIAGEYSSIHFEIQGSAKRDPTTALAILEYVSQDSDDSVNHVNFIKYTTYHTMARHDTNPSNYIVFEMEFVEGETINLHEFIENLVEIAGAIYYIQCTNLNEL